MEKISFFDLVSYLLPGSILIWGVLPICSFDFFGNGLFIGNNELFVSLVLIFFAYLIGMFIHEIAEILEKENKTGNKPMWRYKWVTQVYLKKIKQEKRDIINNELNTLNINPESRDFQIKYFNKISQGQDTKYIHAQSILFRNSFIVAILLLFIWLVYDIYSCVCWSIILQHSICFLFAALMTFWLAVRRKKAIIRTIFWNHANKLSK